MCFVSAVFDQWHPYTPVEPTKWVPTPVPAQPVLPTWPPTPNQQITINQQLGLTLEEMKEFIDAFNKAVEAAKVFDKLTGQPDCEDPEKAQVEARIAALEARIKELENQK